MKKHNGMRPQDIVVLLKIIALGHYNWYNSDLAQSLKISPSEISEVLNRCRIAGLIDSSKRKVNINSLKDFLVYGLKYVFPVEPGAIVRGVPTAHSASPVNNYVAGGKDAYVWSYAKGSLRGQAIEPLYKTLPQIAGEDVLFYELLTIVDTIRIGRVREFKIAVEELEKRLRHD